jgi:(1->4)-alpha-D-glucan 1-alpha-D-glucosylmutase
MQDVLTLKVIGKTETEFVNRFQQFTAPVMAKGVEDTAYYCWNRLTAMNEVGGDPDCDGFSLEHFHEYQVKMQKTFPMTMTTLSTHDTKRSDDVRARMIGALSEIPDAFAEAVRRWSTHNAKYRSGDQIDTWYGVVFVPDAGGGVADQRGAAAGVYAEGDARSEGAD